MQLTPSEMIEDFEIILNSGLYISLLQNEIFIKKKLPELKNIRKSSKKS